MSRTSKENATGWSKTVPSPRTQNGYIEYVVTHRYACAHTHFLFTPLPGPDPATGYRGLEEFETIIFMWDLSVFVKEETGNLKKKKKGNYIVMDDKLLSWVKSFVYQFSLGYGGIKVVYLFDIFYGIGGNIFNPKLKSYGNQHLHRFIFGLYLLIMLLMY